MRNWAPSEKVTMIRRIPSKQRNAFIARERDQGALVRLTLLLVSGLALAGGFVYAGGQHFAALKYGYETEELRQVRDRLAEEQRRFLLAREEAASPLRLERAARQLGMQPMQPPQIDPLKRFVKRSAGKAAPVLSQSARSPARDAQSKSQRNPR
jgi:cell division protein FtsL